MKITEQFMEGGSSKLKCIFPMDDMSIFFFLSR